jgi:hypothetical protein
VHRPDRLIKKKVFFYEIHIDGTRLANNRLFNFERFAELISRLPHTEAGRYLEGGEDSILCAYPNGTRSLRFGRIRRSNLPQLVDGETFEDLPVSALGGILECSHVVYFPPATIGAEFNFYAPRMSRLAQYIRAKLPFDGVFELLPILARDPLQTLQRFESIKEVSLKVATAMAPELRRRRAGPITSVVEAAAEAGVETIDVSLSAPTGRAHQGLTLAIRNGVRNILGIPNVREAIEKLGVRGYFDGATRLDAVDLLADELVSQQQFMKETTRGKTLDEEDAYAKIRQAFNETRPDRLV